MLAAGSGISSRRRLPHISPHIGTKTCPRCRGRGALIEGAMIVMCPKCRGEGEIYEGEEDSLCTGECSGCIFAEDCYPFPIQSQSQSQKERKKEE